MRLGQPDMQREYARFGTEAHKAEQSGHSQLRPLFRKEYLYQLGKRFNLQRAEQAVQKQQANQ
ncbi:hypothetical protein SDC9_95173 [bioreactor metagenome]|uniref:Uncharacterized protein n=1 Tax=bioreactor metagenome TaxID=1076179 RepID=A0A645A6W2_9ZZZZ